VGLDVGMNRHKARFDSIARFDYRTDVEVDSMTLEEVRHYAKRCQDGWNNLLDHGDKGGERYVCELYIYKFNICSV